VARRHVVQDVERAPGVEETVLHPMHVDVAGRGPLPRAQRGVRPEGLPHQHDHRLQARAAVHDVGDGDAFLPDQEARVVGIGEEDGRRDLEGGVVRIVLREAAAGRPVRLGVVPVRLGVVVVEEVVAHGDRVVDRGGPGASPSGTTSCWVIIWSVTMRRLSRM
jgi:hypothetical protein